MRLLNLLVSHINVSEQLALSHSLSPPLHFSVKTGSLKLETTCAGAGRLLAGPSVLACHVRSGVKVFHRRAAPVRVAAAPGPLVRRFRTARAGCVPTAPASSTAERLQQSGAGGADLRGGADGAGAAGAGRRRRRGRHRRCTLGSPPPPRTAANNNHCSPAWHAAKETTFPRVPVPRFTLGRYRGLRLLIIIPAKREEKRLL